MGVQKYVSSSIIVEFVHVYAVVGIVLAPRERVTHLAAIGAMTLLLFAVPTVQNVQPICNPRFPWLRMASLTSLQERQG